jgi:hypothetical protein
MSRGDLFAGGNAMVVTEAIAGLGALKTAFDMAKALENTHEVTTRDRAVIDLQKEILAAQQAQFALVERVRDLERQVAAFENWDAEQKRYQMKDFGGGTIAYSLKPEMANGEPLHNLCSACYQKRKKGILQPIGINAYHQKMMKCAECGTDFVLGQRVERNFSAHPR